MSIEKVRNYLKQFGAEERIIELPESSATVALAADALHCDGSRIAKSISLCGNNDDCILIVTAGDRKIDNAKFKQRFGCKAKMLPINDVENIVGHAVGGVCPFAVNNGVKIYLDESLKRFTTVFPACGSGNSAIELNLEELERFSGGAEWIDVCKK